MICAISGSNGFIGSHLCKKLESLGHEVKRIERDGSFKGRADWIFDCGAYGNLFGQDDENEMYEANVEKLNNLLTRDCKSLIYISSSSVGLETQTEYSKSKKEAEDDLKASVKLYEVPAVIVRPYTVIGTREPVIHLIPKLIKSCMFGEKMPFVPGPVHDFIDVRDLVDALILIAGNSDKYKGEVFEIGSGISTPNWEIKDLVEDVTGSKANIEIVDSLRPYDTKDWKSDNTKIKSLGWEPKYTLKQSIFNMVSEYLPGV